MWADTLFAAEREHVIRLLLWAATSVTLGTAVVAAITIRRVAAPIIFWFSVQTLVWGLCELILVLIAWKALAMRDVSAATRLDRITWLNAGLDVGVIAVGVAIALLAWRYGPRLSGVGAGLGIVVQGLGLLVLNLTFASIVARLI